MNLNGFSNQATASVVKGIETDEVVQFLIVEYSGGIENFGNTDLINTLIEVFESDTTTDGCEIADINCDEVRSFLDELF